MSGGYEVQAGERAAYILEVPVGVVGGMPYVECEQLRKSGEVGHGLMFGGVIAVWDAAWLYGDAI